MATIIVTTNEREWCDAIVAYMAFFGKTRAEALRTQARLLGLRLIQLTPPRTKGQGKRRVKADVGRLFFGQSPGRMADSMDRAARAGGMDKQMNATVALWATKDGTVYGVERHLYRPDATLATMAEHHEKHRDSRGRVTRAGTMRPDVGRWKFVDKMVVPRDLLAEYIRTKQGMVGQARGGWASVVQHFGGAVADWVGQHSSAGSVTDRLDDPVAAYLAMDNRSRWASGNEANRIARNALLSRAVSIKASVQKAEEKAQNQAFRAGRSAINALIE